jgi:phospholipase/carboxylesterase
MAEKELSLHHLVQFPASSQNQGTSSRYPTILALHGRGSNEHGLIDLAPHLPESLLWISPRAPLALGPDSYEWFRVKVIGRPDPIQVMAALETIQHFIYEILSTYAVDPQRLFLLGFSQGSLLSLCYALSHPSHVAGVMAQSGYIPRGVDLEINEAEVKGKPFILTHGIQDTLIPVDWARASRDLLEEIGVDLNYHEFQMGHSVSMESLSVIANWLKKQLAP